MSSASQSALVEQPPLDWPHYGISIVAATQRGFKKYAMFSGRASRSEFWWWIVFVYAGTAVLGILAGVITSLTTPAQADGSRPIGVGGTIFLIAMFAFLLAVLVPTIAITFRRLHDAGYSGWFYLLNLIPYVGGLIVLLLCIFRTSPLAGKYGPPYPAAPQYPPSQLAP